MREEKGTGLSTRAEDRDGKKKDLGRVHMQEGHGAEVRSWGEAMAELCSHET